MKPEQPTCAAQVSVLAFGLLSLLGGWLIVLYGGFTHTPGVHSATHIVVTGLPAVVMALLQYTAATLALMWFLQQRVRPVPSFIVACILVFGPPALYLCLT